MLRRTFVKLAVYLCCRGKPNLTNMGSLMIKPIQRVTKYPLLLCELRNSTPASHPDFGALEEASAAVRDIHVNINELKPRKDLGRRRRPGRGTLHGWPVLCACLRRGASERLEQLLRSRS